MDSPWVQSGGHDGGIISALDEWGYIFMGQSGLGCRKNRNIINLHFQALISK